MADRRLRELEWRRLLAQNPDGRRRILSGRLRQGELSRDRVRLAAWLGDPDARLIVPFSRDESMVSTCPCNESGDHHYPCAEATLRSLLPALSELASWPSGRLGACGPCHGTGRVEMDDAESCLAVPMVRCKGCDGKGQVLVRLDCVYCDGTGKFGPMSWPRHDCLRCKGEGHVVETVYPWVMLGASIAASEAARLKWMGLDNGGEGCQACAELLGLCGLHHDVVEAITIADLYWKDRREVRRIAWINAAYNRSTRPNDWLPCLPRHVGLNESVILRAAGRIEEDVARRAIAAKLIPYVLKEGLWTDR